MWLDEKERFFDSIDALIIQINDIQTMGFAVTALNLFNEGRLGGLYVVADLRLSTVLLSLGNLEERFAMDGGLQNGHMIFDEDFGRIKSWLNGLAARR